MTDSRAIKLHDGDQRGDHVVYLMSRDQRTQDNHALLNAQQKANELSLPLVVVFNLFGMTKNRAYEHAAFILAGLKEVKNNLNDHNVNFVLTAENTPHNLEATLKSFKPAALFFDFSPLKRPRYLAKKIAKNLEIETYVVDTHNIIPVWLASDKQEFAAHTFRRKIHKYLEQYLIEPEKLQKHQYTSALDTQGLTFSQAHTYIENLYPKRNVEIWYKPGENAAKNQLEDFIDQKLQNYSSSRNDIAVEGQSELSPYLHFGHISSLRVALEVLYATDTRPLLFEQAKMAQSGDTPSKVDGMNALFEEMIVRKELSDNFCFYAKSYRDFSSLPEWSRNTLDIHSSDKREFHYSLRQLEDAETHDQIWNTAQKELTTLGKMHGYMRMYWAKKILEWTKTPKEALDYTIILNDRYSIDGGDPNGYVGILWSIAGLHDRPWTERPVFGKVRYMNEAGLKRKFDTTAYINTLHKFKVKTKRTIQNDGSL